VLKPGAKLAARVPPNSAEAVDTYVQDLLTTRWPRHPKLGEKLTKRRGTHLVEVFGQLVNADDRRLTADRRGARHAGPAWPRARDGECDPPRDGPRLQDLDKRREQKSVDQPQVSQLRN